jgi:23S rRNA (adenine2503-C2)-methyltransferase
LSLTNSPAPNSSCRREKKAEAFQQILIKKHFTTMIRASRGSDILAACGQLSGTFGI